MEKSEEHKINQQGMSPEPFGDKDPNKSVPEQLCELMGEITVYEVLPPNSQVVVLDKLFSLYDTMTVMLDNDCDECYIWNSDQFSYDGIVSYTDFVEMLMFIIESIQIEKTEKFKQELQKTENGADNLEDRSKFYGLYSKKISEYVEGVSAKKISFEEESKDSMSEEINIDKETIIQDLKMVNMKNWQSIVYENILWRPHGIIYAFVEEKLIDACIKMKKHKLHRIAVFDRESQLIVGTLTQKDILLFLLLNFPKEMQTIFNRKISELKDLPITSTVFTVDSKQQLVNTFETLLIRRISSIPVVCGQGKLLGHIHKKDLFYVLRDFELEKLAKTNEAFLEMIKKETGYRKSSLDNLEWFFSPDDTLIHLMQKIVLAPGQRLLDINKETRKINAIITMLDLFEFLIPIKEQEETIQTEKA